MAFSSPVQQIIDRNIQMVIAALENFFQYFFGIFWEIPTKTLQHASPIFFAEFLFRNVQTLQFWHIFPGEKIAGLALF